MCLVSGTQASIAASFADLSIAKATSITVLWVYSLAGQVHKTPLRLL